MTNHTSTPSPAPSSLSVKIPKPRRFSRIAPDNDSTSSFFNSSDQLTDSPFSESHPLQATTSTSALLFGNENGISNLHIETTNSHSNVHSQLQTPLHGASYIPPWTEPYIIGIAGNSGSGKTSIAQKIVQELNQPWTVLLSFDNFYNPLTEDERKLAFSNNFDFDTPESLDLNLVVETVLSLKKGHKTTIPVYSFEHHNRTDKTITIYGANVIIIEGIYTLYDPRLLDIMDLKIYVDTDLDICLARRLTRDILYRGRDLSGCLQQWEKFVKPNAVKYVNPTMNNADLIIPRGLDNVIAINLMIKHIEKQLILKSSQHLKYLQTLDIKIRDLNEYNVKILPINNQTKGINSILFNEDTERSDFIFYFDRISTIIIEEGLHFINDFEPITVTAAKSYQYQGLKLVDDIVAISIIRSGDCFMNSIKKTFPEISIGKLLIQSDSKTGEPQLHYDSIPQDIQQNKIMLFDSQIISGAASIMAIQVLLDHDCKPKDIILCCYLSTELGLRRILNVFPEVNIVIGKLSNINDNADGSKWYNPENCKDTDWQFRNRFIDSLYFGTD
ncbi:uridine kinase [Scheffersomyces coipomensis]|uniref:uridine kinase n=1 Tax=Scheffersomyces coipomensis TaxID=1788519 RepID=UPI00315C65DE